MFLFGHSPFAERRCKTLGKQWHKQGLFVSCCLWEGKAKAMGFGEHWCSSEPQKNLHYHWKNITKCQANRVGNEEMLLRAGAGSRRQEVCQGHICCS